MKRIVIAVGVTAILTIGAAALLVNIFERKQEARNAFFRVVELDDDTDDPAVWGKNFPLQYDLYKRTADMVRTRYGGSEAIRRALEAGELFDGERAEQVRRQFENMTPEQRESLLERLAAKLPFAEDLLAAYYCAFDRATPLLTRLLSVLLALMAAVP